MFIISQSHVDPVIQGVGMYRMSSIKYSTVYSRWKTPSLARATQNGMSTARRMFVAPTAVYRGSHSLGLSWDNPR